MTHAPGYRMDATTGLVSHVAFGFDILPWLCPYDRHEFSFIFLNA